MPARTDPKSPEVGVDAANVSEVTNKATPFRLAVRWAAALVALAAAPLPQWVAYGEVSAAMTEDERVRRQKWLARGVTVFVVLSVDEDFQEWREREGEGFEPFVREAIAALNVLCGNERTGPWVSQEARTRMREQLARMQELLDEGGITDEVRQIARGVVEVIFPDAEQWFKENPESAKYAPATGPRSPERS